MISEIKIDKLALEAYLGWSEAEREKLRPVHIAIHLRLPVLPKALESDELSDTLCYQEIETRLVQELNGQSFRLLEHLAHRCYQSIQSLIPAQTEFSLSVTKFLSKQRGSRTFVLRSAKMTSH